MPEEVNKGGRPRVGYQQLSLTITEEQAEAMRLLMERHPTWTMSDALRYMLDATIRRERLFQ